MLSINWRVFAKKNVHREETIGKLHGGSEPLTGNLDHVKIKKGWRFNNGKAWGRIKKVRKESGGKK